MSKEPVDNEHPLVYHDGAANIADWVRRVKQCLVRMCPRPCTMCIDIQHAEKLLTSLVERGSVKVVCLAESLVHAERPLLLVVGLTPTCA